MKRELFALSVVLATLVVFPGALFGYQALRVTVPGVRVVEIAGFAPVSGSWQPEVIRVNLGERVRLRISSADVVHGLVAPALGIDVEEILPGHVVEVEFVADRAGRFPFACTRWCSLDHWRMRGAIEVIDPANPNAPLLASGPPLYQQLDVDPDAPRVLVTPPPQRPAAARGAPFGGALPPEFTDRDWTRVHSPKEMFDALKSDPATSRLGDGAVWDLVAYAWWKAATPEGLARGKKLFQRDCTECHGNRAKLHPALTTQPADFADASRMLGASDILLQAKALRGGMGTGMPEWGSLYGDEDLRAVISFVRSFSFEYPASP